MAHEIETTAYVGETPWHGLGTYVGDDPVTSQEMIVASELDWNVEKRPLFTLSNDEERIDIDTHKTIVRAMDEKILGVVGNRYTPVQNVEAFEFLDALVEDGSMRYHTAGSLRGGQRIWALAQIGTSEIVPGDQLDRYLFLWNTHDGSGSLRCLFTNVRVVCANTARAALQNGKGEGVYLRHTASIKAKLEKARKVLGVAAQKFDEHDARARELAKIELTDKMREELALAIIPDNEEAKNHTRTEKARETFLGLIDGGIGQDIPGVGGTAWGGFNALTEYANYHQWSRNKDAAQARRFESSLFGPGAKLIDTGAAKLNEFLAAA